MITDFFKYNKVIFLGVLFSIFFIGVGIIFNIGGIAIAALLTFFISVVEVIRKLIRQMRYTNWLKKHSGKFVVNLYSEEEIEEEIDLIKTLLNEDFLLVSRDNINDKILVDLATRNNFDLDESLLISVSTERIEVSDIQNDFNLLLNGDIDMINFNERIKDIATLLVITESLTSDIVNSGKE